MIIFSFKKKKVENGKKILKSTTLYYTLGQQK